SGDINLKANMQATPASGDFYGIYIGSASITSNLGSVTLQGRGGDGGGTEEGVAVVSGSTISGAGVNITGIGGLGTGAGQNNSGLIIAGGTTTTPCISSSGDQT